MRRSVLVLSLTLAATGATGATAQEHPWIARFQAGSSTIHERAEAESGAKLALGGRSSAGCCGRPGPGRLQLGRRVRQPDRGPRGAPVPPGRRFTVRARRGGSAGRAGILRLRGRRRRRPVAPPEREALARGVPPGAPTAQVGGPVVYDGGLQLRW